MNWASIPIWDSFDLSTYDGFWLSKFGTSTFYACLVLPAGIKPRIYDLLAADMQDEQFFSVFFFFFFELTCMSKEKTRLRLVLAAYKNIWLNSTTNIRTELKKFLSSNFIYYTNIRYKRTFPKNKCHQDC